MTNVLERMHITYHPEQDRLLLRVDTGSAGEYRVWLTRRYSELLLGLVADLIDKEGGMQRLASREDTRALLRSGALTQQGGLPALDATEAPLPLGANGILGYRINYGRDQPELVTLQLLPEQGEGLNMNMNPPTLYLFYTMLEQGGSQADWQLRLAGHRKDPVH